MSSSPSSQSANARGARPIGSAFLRLVPDSTQSKQQISLGDGSAQNNWSHLVSAVDSGAAVMVSRTSDGGAISLTLYLGQLRYREYASTPDQLDRLFDAMDAACLGQLGHGLTPSRKVPQ